MAKLLAYSCSFQPCLTVLMSFIYTGKNIYFIGIIFFNFQCFEITIIVGKDMLHAVLTIYITWLLSSVLTTVCLLICGYSWGRLPHLYVKLIKLLQSFYPQNYPQSDQKLWPAIIKRCNSSLLRKHHDDSLSSFYFR